MAEYTPGSWAVGQYIPTPNFLAITNHSCICDSKTMALIATCGRADDRQSQIDADLIAAAPDLLAASEAALAACPDREFPNNVQNQLAFAIGRARGYAHDQA